MAKAGGKGRAGAGRRTAAKGTPVRTSRGAPKPKPQAKAAPKKRASAAPAAEQRTTPGVFRLGVIPGATPGKWIDTWKLRMPYVTLELVPIAVAEQRDALAELDGALVRLPIQDADLHVIRLYDERAVVVASVDSHLMAADELDTPDLAGEVLLTSGEDVYTELDLPGTTPLASGALPTTADVIATVATGVGIAVIPMSLARQHHRKDVEYRVLRDGPTSTVAFVWPRERSTDDVDAFVGILRGRTANSSR